MLPGKMLLRLVCFFLAITGSRAGDCDPIPVCSNLQKIRIEENSENQPIIEGLKNESEIGRQGHWEGIVPENYDVDLTFLNRTHYNGSVEITVKVVQATRRIMINHHVANPQMDYSKITIKPVCQPAWGRKKRSTVATTRCIEKATFLEAERTLILDLKGVELRTDKKYKIIFGSFRGRSQDEYGSEGAIGLREATNEDGGDMGNYSATTTIFQMRYARTVFPCFDHPALKASFSLCLNHPSDVRVASNTQSVGSKSVGNGRTRDCFQPTPVIPSYVFTFSLMHNYASESVQVPGGPTIEVLAPAGGIQGLRWILNESVPVVQYMEKITGFKFPLKKLAFVAQYPAPFWGVENFGLVTVDGTHMQGRGELAYTILYHEIVHQWLGNVITVEEWKEICLQEGLTAYFEWKISAERRNGNLDRKADQERRSSDDVSYYEPYALKDYGITQDIADNCFGRPPVFFHTIAKKEGFETIEKFLASLIKKRPYGTADIEMWDQTLNEVSKGRDLKGYIKGWFQQPGPLYLNTFKSPGTDCIVIRQKVYKEDGLETVARPVPLHVQTYGSSSTRIPTVLKTLEDRVCGVGDSIYLVDPESHTFTRKAYTADNYRRVLQLHKQNPAALTVEQVKNFVRDFCKALLENVLPLSDEPSSTKPSDWLEVYRLVRNSSVELGRTCKICTNSKEENENPKQQQWIWNRWCSEGRLNQVLGRNYTFGA